MEWPRANGKSEVLGCVGLPHVILKVHKLDKRLAFLAQRVSILRGDNAMILARKRSVEVATKAYIPECLSPSVRSALSGLS